MRYFDKGHRRINYRCVASADHQLFVNRKTFLVVFPYFLGWISDAGLGDLQCYFCGKPIIRL